MSFRESSEKGQVLVLVTLAIIVLLGFTALAIDGGLVYSDRRHAQNSTDAASLAGGAAAAMKLENRYVEYTEWKCNDPDVIRAQVEAKDSAVERAASNDFSIERNITNENGVATECGSFDNGSWIDNYIDITTMITTDTPTAFAHFVYDGPLRNTVTAVTRVRPQSPVAFGNAVVALREDCPNTSTGGVHYDGTLDLDVHGGGIFSNACMVATGDAEVTVDNGGITCIGDDCFTYSGSPSVDPDPESATFPLPRSSHAVPTPNCEHESMEDEGSVSGSADIGPGRYTGIRLNATGDVLNMEPGLYCVSGDFVANGGEIYGTGVTIYVLKDDHDNNTNFDISGNVEVNLSAPALFPHEVCTVCPPAMPGLLIYMAEGNEGEVHLSGTSDSYYEGVVYAPNGTIKAGGTADELSVINAQLIADTVEFVGTATVDINFDNGLFYQLPAMLELYE